MENTKTVSQISWKKLVSYFKSREIEVTDSDLNASWHSLEHKIESRRNRLRFTVAAAFAAAVVMAGLAIAFDKLGQGKKELIADHRSNFDEVTLILSSGKEVPLSDGATIEYSDGRIKADNEEIDLVRTHDGNDKLIVPDGKSAKLVLADGTTMYINAGSEVTFPPKFASSERTISINGEAYLDVKHDENAPFTVSTAKFKISVLGTAFNVNAYDNSSSSPEVVLLRGKVEVVSKTGENVILSPDQKASVSMNGDIAIDTVNANEYILWTKGILSLDATKIRSVVERMSHYYGVKITCSDDIADIELDGKLDLESGVWKALNWIANVGGFNLLRKDGGYELTSR